MEDDEYRKIICEWFAESETPHGTEFDDGRRWCGSCEGNRWPVAASEDRPMQHMLCPVCTAVWPEYVQEVAETIAEDGMDAFDTVQDMVMH